MKKLEILKLHKVQFRHYQQASCDHMNSKSNNKALRLPSMMLHKGKYARPNLNLPKKTFKIGHQIITLSKNWSFLSSKLTKQDFSRTCMRSRLLSNNFRNSKDFLQNQVQGQQTTIELQKLKNKKLYEMLLKEISLKGIIVQKKVQAKIMGQTLLIKPKHCLSSKLKKIQWERKNRSGLSLFQNVKIRELNIN